MMINKCQEQSLGTVGINLCYPVFSHSQFYVAVSRARNCGRIQILLEEQETRNETSNIVYREILLRWLTVDKIHSLG